MSSYYVFHDGSTTISGNGVQWVECPKGISWHFRKMPEKSFSCCLTSQPNRPRWMKAKSVKVPGFKDLLDRPFDLETVELAEAAMRAAGFGANWSSKWGDALRSLKPHGSSPENVLDLLLLLDESSDEKMQQMGLDDVTLEQVPAARRALREALRRVELSMKLGEEWYCSQVAPWLVYLKSSRSWWLGSEDLPWLQALDARASTLMTRLEEEAEKENHTTCLQEVAWTRLAFCFLTPKWYKIWIHRWNEKSNPCDFWESVFFVGGVRQQPPR